MLRKEFLARIMDRIGQNALDDFPSHKLDGSVSSLVGLNRWNVHMQLPDMLEKKSISAGL